MNLAIDIGNTNINFGIFKNNKFVKSFFIKTREKWLIKYIRRSLKKSSPTKVIISSVAPEATLRFTKALNTITCIKPIIIGRDLIVPIKNLYRRPKQVGQDRLVNAYAATKLYGAPLIIVDFGTAITFDIISKNKEYLGGMILPGLNISLETLFEKTALLPKVKLEAPKEFIGRDTKNSILSGIVYGFSTLTDNLTEKIKSPPQIKTGPLRFLAEKIGKKTKVIATGGNVELISKFCRNIDIVDKNLTLKGLNLLAQIT